VTRQQDKEKFVAPPATASSSRQAMRIKASNTRRILLPNGNTPPVLHRLRLTGRNRQIGGRMDSKAFCMQNNDSIEQEGRKIWLTA
jgi:hypothetical protein